VTTSDANSISDEFLTDPADDDLEVFLTFGKISEAGCIDLIIEPKSGELQLVYGRSRGKRKIGRTIEVDGDFYEPGDLNRTFLNATVLPIGIAKYGSTLQLFESTLDLFKARGFSDDVAFVSTVFAFSTWFPESFAIAPCLAISGPPVESSFLLQLLECVVRRPLEMGELNRNIFALVPPEWNPTLLIHDLSRGRRSSELLAISNQPGSHLPCKGTLVETSCAKAVRVGTRASLDNFSGAIPIRVTPICVPLPILTPGRQRRIIRDFQPQFLAYRIANQVEVSASQFDLPDCSSEIRVLGRTLASSIVEAPEIIVQIAEKMRSLEEELQADQWSDTRFLVAESLLSLCHEREAGKIYVGEIAKSAQKISRGRGQETTIEARLVGEVLRSFGFRPHRTAPGIAITLDVSVRRRIHEVAHGFNLDGTAISPTCTLCVESLHPGPAKTNECEGPYKEDVQ